MAKIIGDIEKARSYSTSTPEIEWTCCKGVCCGHASRIGLDHSTRLAVYRLSSFRHPMLTGTCIVVGMEGEILKLGSLQPIRTPEQMAAILAQPRY